MSEEELQRRGRGRPPFPERERLKARHVTIDDERWEWCQAQEEGAAAYLRRLIDEDRKMRGGRTG